MAVVEVEIDDIGQEFSVDPLDADIQMRALRKSFDQLYDGNELTVDNLVKYIRIMLDLFDTFVGLLRVNRYNMESLVKLSNLGDVVDGALSKIIEPATESKLYNSVYT